MANRFAWSIEDVEVRLPDRTYYEPVGGSRKKVQGRKVRNDHERPPVVRASRPEPPAGFRDPGADT